MFGDVAQFGYDYPASSSGGGSGRTGSAGSGVSSQRMAVCAKEHPAFVIPASYALDWYQSVGGVAAGGAGVATRCYFWRPEASPAQQSLHVALGYVVTTEPNPPPLTLVRLVNKKYLIENRGAGALAQIWADTRLKLPLYMSLLLNPKNIITHTVNHFLHDEQRVSVKLSGALQPPSAALARKSVAAAFGSDSLDDAEDELDAAGGGGSSGDSKDGGSGGDVKTAKPSAAVAAAAAKKKANAAAAALAAAKKREADAEAEANAASMDLLNTAISSVSGVYSFVDGVRVALTAPQHNDVSLSIWNSRDLNTFALNTTHARPVGTRYRFPLRDEERRSTLLRLYRDGVLMLAECIRQLGGMVVKVQRMERLKQRQKEAEQKAAAAAAAAKAKANHKTPERKTGPAPSRSHATAEAAAKAASKVDFPDDPAEEDTSPRAGTSSPGPGSDGDSDDWVDEKQRANNKAKGIKTDDPDTKHESSAVELSYAQTRELVEAIHECLEYEALMSRLDDDSNSDLKVLNIEREIRDSQAKVAQLKLDLADLKRYIKRYVKLDICSELEVRSLNISAMGDTESLKWAISKMSEAWDVCELLPSVDWPEAVSWDFTLEELRIPKIKETVRMMIANPPATFNTRMTQWVLDSFRKFISSLHTTTHTHFLLFLRTQFSNSCVCLCV